MALILPSRFTRQPQYAAGIKPGNPYANKFWYPIGNQFFSAHDGTRLARATGSSPIANTPNGRALVGDGSTYFSVPPITLSGSFSVNVFASGPSGSSQAAMPIGDAAGTTSFLWLNSGDGSSARWRLAGDANFTNSNINTPAVYGISVSGTRVLVYKNGILLIDQYGSNPSLTLSAIGTGYSSSTYNLNGGVILGVQAHTSRALSANEMRAVAENFWLPLKTPVRVLYVAEATASGNDAAIAWLEESDVTAIAGSLAAFATTSWTETDDTTAITAGVGSSVSAAAAWAEADDATALAATLTVASTAAWTEESDTAAIAANCAASAAASWMEVDDAAAMSGVATIAATVSWAEQSDIASAAASVGDVVSASAAWVESDDVASALSVIQVSADAGWSEESDLTGFSVTVLASAGLAWAEQDDAASATVDVSPAPSAALYWSEESDLCAMTGISDGIASYARAPNGAGYTRSATQQSRPSSGNTARPAQQNTYRGPR